MVQVCIFIICILLFQAFILIFIFLLLEKSFDFKSCTVCKRMSSLIVCTFDV